MHQNNPARPLLLLRILSLSLGLGSLLPRTLVPLVGTCSPQRDVCVLGALGQVTLLHLAHAVLNTSTNLDGQDGTNRLDDLVGVGSQLDVLGCGVELLVLAGLEWEQNEAGLVGLQTGDVEFEGFLRGGLAAVVDGDTDCGCELAGNAGGL